LLAALHVQQSTGLNFITRDQGLVERCWGTPIADECGEELATAALVGVVHLGFCGTARAQFAASGPQTAGRWENTQWEKMAAMAVICITGSSDGIGLATARVLVADGHRVLIHARNRDRGRPVLEQLGGETTLVTGDLAQLDEVHRLADQIHANGPVDALVHNAGVWVRGNTPRTTADGLETTFAVNVLAPHLLTSLLAADLQGRLLWLGSGSANFGRPDPATLGRPQEPSQAYSDSKACDVALALAWGRRLPRVASAARPNWPALALPVMSHRPRTPSPTAAPMPIWPPPRTGRTGRGHRFRDTCRTRRCKTRSLRPATGWRGSTDHSEWSSFSEPRPSEQVYGPGRPANKRRLCESLWDATRGPPFDLNDRHGDWEVVREPILINRITHSAEWDRLRIETGSTMVGG
jgi:NAD(P)-dependent dehydrogenase (short-subunit alcohol dehydrogenase family)